MKNPLIKELILVFLIIIICCFPIIAQYSIDTSEIKIDAINTSNNDIENINRLFLGASWEYPITDTLWGLLEKINLRKLRIINIESDILSYVKEESKFEYNWNGSLSIELKDCKRYGLIPHIIVGLALLPPFSKETIIGPRFDEDKWDEYNNFAYNFIKFVCIDKGFDNAEFEVGNEPDWDGVKWLSETNLGHGSKEAYFLYLKVYETWSNAFEKLKIVYPYLNIKIGGPAITVNPFIPGRFNYGTKFIEDIANKKIKADFFSLHYYGDNSSVTGNSNIKRVPSLSQIINTIKESILLNKIDLPIILTEWGPSVHTERTSWGEVNANNVGATWTANFLNYANNLSISEAYLLLIRDIPVGGTGKSKIDNWGWPAYFTLNSNTPKPIYNVVSMFSKMKGKILNISNNQSNINLIASLKNDSIYILLYNYNWDYINNIDNSKPEIVKLNVNLKSINFKKIQIKKFEINNIEGNLNYYIQNNLPLDKANANLNYSIINSIINNNILNISPLKMGQSSVVLLEISTK